MKIKFGIKNCLTLAAAVLGLVATILAIVSHTTPTAPLQGFVFVIIASIVAIAIFVVDFLGIIKIKPLRDGLVILATVLLAVCVGLIIMSRAYAFGTTVLTKVESHNPFIVKSFSTGLVAGIFYGITILVTVVRSFFPDSKESIA